VIRKGLFVPMSDQVVAPELYINRELSWIAFNSRVLAQALNEQTPLLEQAKFSAIFSNNLDEFFMVRVASLKSQLEAGVTALSDDGLTPSSNFSRSRRPSGHCWRNNRFITANTSSINSPTRASSWSTTNGSIKNRKNGRISISGWRSSRC